MSVDISSQLNACRCIYFQKHVCNNRCRHQSITQQHLKRCLIKNANNYMYMFWPIAAIIRFSFESMVVGLVWLYHDGEISTSVMFVIVKGNGGGYL